VALPVVVAALAIENPYLTASSQEALLLSFAGDARAISRAVALGSTNAPPTRTPNPVTNPTSTPTSPMSLARRLACLVLGDADGRAVGAADEDDGNLAPPRRATRLRRQRAGLLPRAGAVGDNLNSPVVVLTGGDVFLLRSRSRTCTATVAPASLQTRTAAFFARGGVQRVGKLTVISR